MAKLASVFLPIFLSHLCIFMLDSSSSDMHTSEYQHIADPRLGVRGNSKGDER